MEYDNIFCNLLIQSGHIGRAITQTGLKNTSRVASMSAYLQLHGLLISSKSHFPPKSRLPDHGDVWCSSSNVEIAGAQVALTTSIRSLPLRFTKKCQMQEKVVRLDYEVTNLSQSDVKFLWSAHPLLRVEPDAEIGILPQEVKEVEVNWSKDERLGKSGDRCTQWPRRLNALVEPWSAIELFLRLPWLRLRKLVHVSSL